MSVYCICLAITEIAYACEYVISGQRVKSAFVA